MNGFTRRGPDFPSVPFDWAHDRLRVPQDEREILRAFDRQVIQPPKFLTPPA
ncbi:hypothetical protein Thivi_0770 [Thiocystis violascens DSM 198]|uniref:Uncharacterized protein n=1 Tax=Thiocystis violascens (strain ATCC 17096 / DSM 198 / 6111) TaxID=765911 RepID=I3Y753_THIV6|nr:hypothetical protein Thivi_0770 [Thiocystis violascens DSM 198]